MNQNKVYIKHLFDNLDLYNKITDNNELNIVYDDFKKKIFEISDVAILSKAIQDILVKFIYIYPELSKKLISDFSAQDYANTLTQGLVDLELTNLFRDLENPENEKNGKEIAKKIKERYKTLFLQQMKKIKEESYNKRLEYTNDVINQSVTKILKIMHKYNFIKIFESKLEDTINSKDISTVSELDELFNNKIRGDIDNEVLNENFNKYINNNDTNNIKRLFPHIKNEYIKSLLAQLEDLITNIQDDELYIVFSKLQQANDLFNYNNVNKLFDLLNKKVISIGNKSVVSKKILDIDSYIYNIIGPEMIKMEKNELLQYINERPEIANLNLQSESDTRSDKRSDKRSNTRSNTRSDKRSNTRSDTRSDRRSNTRSDKRSDRRSNTRSDKRSDRRSNTRSDKRSNTRSDKLSNTRSDTRSKKRSNTQSDKRSVNGSIYKRGGSGRKEYRESKKRLKKIIKKIKRAAERNDKERVQKLFLKLNK